MLDKFLDPSAATACDAVNPDNFKRVPLAAPILGVTKTGDVSITNFVPVPVWDAMEVALPVDVMGPVKLAFVVTFDAVPVRLAVIVPAEKLPELSRATI